MSIEHTCKYPGCKNVLVLDGNNMKNRRDVCMAKDSGYICIPTDQDISNQAAHHPHNINLNTAINMIVEHACLTYCADEGDSVVEMILEKRPLGAAHFTRFIK